jgi:prepilin signal peptidase PulO-like enzyme (type II secretory pathway)
MLPLGCVVGGLLNHLIHVLSWQPKFLSPFKTPLVGTQRHWLDCIPVVGWIHAAFRAKNITPYLRPLCVELITAALFAGFYWWEVEKQMVTGLRLEETPANLSLFTSLSDALGPMCWVHLALICLMTVATWIDVDEKLIPDGITVPGTLLGLITAAWLPWSRLPGWRLPQNSQLEFLHSLSPSSWPRSLSLGSTKGMALALGCYWLWCLGLLDRRWIGRRGIGKGITYFFARLTRRFSTYWIAALAVLGTIALVAARSLLDFPQEVALMSSLFGMAFGGGMIWGVRIVARWALGREAMGFGDVTLMAMIGSFLGWQTPPMILFFGSMLALVMAISHWLATGEQEIYFGPFLCLGALATIFFWNSVWDYCRLSFEIWWLVPAMMGFGLFLMPALLLAIRFVKLKVAGQ